MCRIFHRSFGIYFTVGIWCEYKGWVAPGSSLIENIHLLTVAYHKQIEVRHDMSLGAHLHGVNVLGMLPRWMFRNVVNNVGRVQNPPCRGRERRALIQNGKIEEDPVPSRKPIKWANEIV